MQENQILGFKYQIYDGDELKIYRVVSYKNDDVLVVNTKTDKPRYVKRSELIDKYIKLTPDAFINIMLTDIDEKDDVYVCVNKGSDLSAGVNVPALILRQNCLDYDKSQLMININQKIYVGQCVIHNGNNTSDMIGLMEYDSIDYSVSIAAYVDDTLEDIIKCIPHKIYDRINKALKTIKEPAKDNPIITGYYEDFKKLLINNNFIPNYRRIFNILQVNWPVDLGKQSHNAEGDIILNNKQRTAFEKEIRQYVDNIRVIKYDKDINISNIVASPHVLISDSNEIIYLVAYDIVGDFPVDSDIAKAMHYNK